MKPEEALALIRESATDRDIRGCVVGLAALSDEAGNLIKKVMAANLLPGPRNPDYQVMLDTILRACCSLLEDGGAGQRAADYVELALLVYTLDALRIRRDLVAERLAKLDTMLDSPATQIARATAYNASQLEMIHVAALQEGMTSAGLDLERMMADHLATEDANVHVSPGGSTELHLEVLELIVRHALYVCNGHVSGEIDTTRSPYEDGHFEVHLRLAVLWRVIEKLEGMLRSGYWRVRMDEVDTLYLCPLDEKAEAVAAIGRRRESNYTDIRVASQLRYQARDLSISQKHIARMAHSLTIPNAGFSWDGTLDIDAYRSAVGNTQVRAATNTILRERVYEELAAKVALPTNGGKLSWSIWFDIYEALWVLASAFASAISSQVENRDGHGCMRMTVLIEEALLIRVLCSTLSHGKETIRAALRLLTFSSLPIELEVYARPLMPMPDGHVLLSPVIFLTMNPRHLVELLADAASETFDIRGTAFELLVEQIFAGNKFGLRVCRGLKVPSAIEGRELEFDLVVWWQRHLFLMEAKCLKAANDPVRLARARAVVDYSASQLELRRRVVIEEWPLFRKQMEAFDLPDACIPVESIHLLSIPSIFQFTGIHLGDVWVVDHMALRRFFQSERIRGWAIGDSGAEPVVEGPRIWTSSKPTAEDLVRYVQRPPQVEHLRDQMEWEWTRLARLTEEETLIAYSIPQFGRQKQ